MAEGRYANCFKIGHNLIEFIIDFGQCFDASSPETFHTRIVISPVDAQGLSKLLEQAVTDYEDSFGAIQQDI